MFPTVPPPSRRLLVFARLPERGKVKTRLAAEIGEGRAFAVYEAMLRDLLGVLGSSTPEMEIECFWPPTPAANGELLRRAFAHHSAAMQTGATLGDRLSMAFSERFFFHGTEKIVVIGADDPALSRELIDHAFALLDSCEYVAGPAEDGGYYLLGCRAASFDPIVFTGIEWGTSTVLTETVRRISATRRTLALLPQHYDIDTATDLARFAAAPVDGELARLLREEGEECGFRQAQWGDGL